MMAVVIAVLSVFATAVAFQARQVQKEAERTREESAAANEVAQFMVDLFETSDPWEASNITAQEILDRGAATIRSKLIAQPLAQARLMDTIGKVFTQMGLT